MSLCNICPVIVLIDIDECVSNTHNCDPHASCTNSVGSFGCTCNTGFSGDGRNCTGKINCDCRIDGWECLIWKKEKQQQQQANKEIKIKNQFLSHNNVTGIGKLIKCGRHIWNSKDRNQLIDAAGYKLYSKGQISNPSKLILFGHLIGALGGKFKYFKYFVVTDVRRVINSP